jgi:hypothetical protein
MSANDLGPALRRLYGEPTSDPRKREALERTLLSRYDARVLRRPRRPLSLAWVAAALLLVSGAALAMAMPAQVPVEVGKRVLVHLPPRGAVDTVPTVVADVARESGAKVMDLWVKAHGNPRSMEVEVDVWGDRLPGDDDMARKLQERIPEASGVEVRSLAGRVNGTVLRSVAERLLRKGASPEERAAARNELIEELRKKHGTRPQLEVEVREGEDGRHMLKLKVRQEEEERNEQE